MAARVLWGEGAMFLIQSCCGGRCKSNSKEEGGGSVVVNVLWLERLESDSSISPNNGDTLGVPPTYQTVLGSESSSKADLVF
ncbi:hypothetical protein V496_09057 [Pseudogymnoascus sp. VKM F-4515 (FW-2607)]|nr:hypothetical protein V496_09057 [Pseudogymnoascus sp. VKM F-4515 (FW-2607)]